MEAAAREMPWCWTTEKWVVGAPLCICTVAREKERMELIMRRDLLMVVLVPEHCEIDERCV